MAFQAIVSAPQAIVIAAPALVRNVQEACILPPFGLCAGQISIKAKA
jgi:hypothetical protein